MLHLTHLLYADYMIISCQAIRQNEVAVCKCLEKFSKWYGQMVNVEKSTIFFQVIPMVE